MSLSHREVSLPFRDRAEAGRLLADRVARLGLADPLVLALPRGGVPVAREVALRLGAPLDVLVTRKIGCPGQPELGVGAIAEDGRPVFDDEILARLGLTPADLAETVTRERAELGRRVSAYRAGCPKAEAAGRDVVIVDDGLATGGTARAALRAVRGRDPARLVLAVPVGAEETVDALTADADDVVTLATPIDFRAVGQWYADFRQLTDAEVVDLLTGSGG